MKSKGRPPVKPIKFMDGYYIEVKNSGSMERGIKIRCADKASMQATAEQYRKNNKEVIILGEPSADSSF